MTIFELEKYLSPAPSASTLASLVEQAIRNGQFGPGDQLPPVRSLASSLEINPATVAKAYRTLALRGLVLSRGRAGTRVAVQPAIERRVPAPLPAGLRNLADGNPDPKLLPDIRRALRNLRAEPVLYDRLGFLPSLATIAREEFAADGVPTDGLTVVGGALDGIERVLLAHARPGDRIALEDPGFPRLIDLSRTLGLEPVPVACDDSGPTLAGLRAALTRRPRLFVHTPRGQNPTGAALDAVRAAHLRELIVAHPELVVIEDDNGILSDDVPFVGLLDRDRSDERSWAIVRSFAKGLGPDLRVAVMAGDPFTISQVEARQALGTGWVSTILQEATVWLLTDPKTTTLLARASKIYSERRQALLDALANYGVPIACRSGFNVWVPVADEAAAVASLRDGGWAVSGGQPYRLASRPGVRVTTSTLGRDEAPALAAALAAAGGRRSYSA
jgi:DNA-binding transcriptional MocR family regulator